MKVQRLPITLLLGALILPATVAVAHTGHGDHHHGSSFLSGFSHPLFGWDHLVAMVAVGFWASQTGGSARWLLPLAFISMMLIGGLLGVSGVGLPMVESGIAASILVIGLLTALAVRVPLIVGALLAGFFAIFHGHAHGAEMAVGSQALLYAIGFATATALLHGVGVALGAAVHQTPRLTVMHRARVFRAGGALVAFAGAAALLF